MVVAQCPAEMLTSALPLLLVIVSIAVLAFTGNLFTPSPFVIAIQAAAIGLSIWARRTFEQGAFRVSAAPGAPAVMRRGPYRFVRHPMYVAVLLFVWTAVISHLSWFTAAIGLAVTTLIVARVIAEERLLRATYPDYQEYARSTKALVPLVF
jgi:protein-S-isoprenylcysteine O-methyltransferase Ste14